MICLFESLKGKGGTDSIIHVLQPVDRKLYVWTLTNRVLYLNKT